ncbi:MAG: hypothetical protein ACOVQR_07265 [Flavobacterium sp.]|jgi:hypothetical protein|uniref:hypothetical protein n=1 Tax=Flavobacterium sp. TaxID=239 RepID=UPI003BA4D2B4
MEQKEFELIVSENKRSIWSLILASIFFTITVFSILYFIKIIYQLGFDKIPVKFPARMIELIVFSAGLGVTFSITKTILIDVDKNKLISRYFIGSFYKDILSEVPKLEYISVFFLSSKEVYEVNLWYNQNKHYKMYVFDNKNSAFEFAVQVVNKLNLDLLDATEKGNFKWIEKKSFE